MSDHLTIVFDLDDTLYLERDFARSGYDAVDAHLEERLGISGTSTICWDLFERGERAKIFDRALKAKGVTPTQDLIQILIDVYRSHAPRISLQPDAERYLKRHRDQRRALITDGPVATQRAKVEALKLETWVEQKVYSDAWGVSFRKPHPKPYEAVEAWADRPPSELVYIADNPTKDFITPRARGWRTVQIARPGRVHTKPAPDPTYEADLVVETLDAIDAVLGLS